MVAGDVPSVVLRDWMWLLLAGLLSTALAYTLFIVSLPKIKASEAAIISAMEPIYAIAMAWLVLGEAPNTKTMIGGAIIIMTALWSSVKPRTD